jgi:hypothetical protein
MSKHIEQVRHNKKLVAFLEKQSEQQFLDWQITVVFYTALHLIHALAEKKRIYIGSAHTAVHNNLNPDNIAATMPLPEIVYQSYICLYEHSRNARYKCWAMNTNIRLLQFTFNESKTYLSEIEEYCHRQGVK